MRPRTVLALIVTVCMTGALAGQAQAVPPPSPSPSAGADARVRLTGELVRTSVERAGDRQHTAVRVGTRFVPVTGGELDDVTPRSTVTVDVAVPQLVTDAAAADTTLSVPAVGARPQRHDLDPADLRAASDTTPAGATSTIGRATQDAAFTPGADPLDVQALVTTSAAKAAYSSATRRITYVEVTPRGLTRSPVTSTQAQQQVAGADGYWRDNSRSELRVGAPTVRPRIASAYSCTDDPFAMWSEAAERSGWRLVDNTSLVLVLPRAADRAGCGYGLGMVGSSPNDGGIVQVADTAHPVLSHELGHNMSLGHADVLACNARSDARRASTGLWSNGCQEVEYGDGFDIMALNDRVSTPMLSAPQAVRTGMLSPSATATVGRGTTEVTLRPVSGRAGTRAARVTNAATGATYYVEYRTATGRDASNAWQMTSGVRVLRHNPAYDSSVLLDPTPTGGHDLDAVLQPGRSLSSYDGKVRVTTLSTSPDQAVVRISNSGAAAPFALRSAPRITGTKGVGRPLTASPGSWSPTPSSTTYRWKRNGAEISGATGRTYTPKTADAGRYLTVTVTARRSGYTSKAVTSARVSIPIHATKRPYLRGTPKAGATMTVMVGAWTPRPTSYTYRWYRNGSPISGATARTYRVRSADRGRTVQAMVTARRTGYSTGQVRTYSKVIAR